MSYGVLSQHDASGANAPIGSQSLPVRILLRGIVIGFLGIAASGVGHAVHNPVREESHEAARLVASLIEEGATSQLVPDGFEEETGYRPVSTATGLMSPRGGCSTQVATAPEFFEEACRTHDLGYDTLRYADRAQTRLGPWARFDLDLRLYNDLLRTCETATCRTTATAYYTAVTANSIRQGYGAPTAEPIMPWVGFALAVAALSVVTTPGAIGRLISVTTRDGHRSSVSDTPGPAMPTLSGRNQPVS